MSRFIVLTIAIIALLSCTEKKESVISKAASVQIKNFLNEDASARQERMAWWKDARFGIFIHWGLYAVPAGEYNGQRTERIGEWIMDHLEIPIAEYEKFASQFNPVKFDADEWVSLIKEAGAKYIVITSKHHDGFALWDSEVSEWDVAGATPYKKDIIKQISEACQKQGIRLCFYHSIMDWHHPQAQAIWEPNYNQGKKSTKINPEFPEYLNNYLKPQLYELVNNFGDIGVMWFDGEWIPDYTSEMGKEIYNYVRSLKPDIIINNRVDVGRQGMQGMNTEGDFAGDFGTPEQEIPDTGMPGVDWESCMTMNDSWGFKHFDHNWKSDTILIRNLVDIVSKGGNFLLNIGPTAEGVIPQPSVDRLKILGNWLKINGESIYGAQASPVEKPEWGRYTQKGDRIYAHVFDWPKDRKLNISGFSTAKKAYLLSDSQQKSLAISKTQDGAEISLPEKAPDPIASVIVLEMEGSVQ